MLKLPTASRLTVLGLSGALLAGCGGRVTSSGTGGTAGGVIAPAGGSATGGAPWTGGTSAGGTTAPATGGQPMGPCSGLPYEPPGADGGLACTGTDMEPELAELDIYLMLDRSQSMDYLTQCDGNDVCISTRWEDLKAAVASFVVDPDVLGQDVRAGIQFLGQTGGYSDNDTDCNPEVYGTPAVEIAPLAESGPQIMAAIEATFPSGETPSVPALQGAIEHAMDWQAANPIRQTVVLWVTDGTPTMCEISDAAFIQAAAAGMANDPPIRTYIIAVSVGANRFTLNGVANSGGSTRALLVDDADLTEALLSALKTITAQPLPCEYTVPADPDPLRALDYDLVQVLHTPATGPQQEVPYVTNRGGCDSGYGGWYYDVPPNLGTPSMLIMCPCTCASLNVGTVYIHLGCHVGPTGLD